MMHLFQLRVPSDLKSSPSHLLSSLYVISVNVGKEHICISHPWFYSRFSEGSAQKSLGSVFVSQPRPLVMRLGLVPGRYSYHLDVLLFDLQNNSAR